MKREAIEQAARILYDARVGHYQINSLPQSCTPRTLDYAYAVQQRLLELLDTDTAGWLLGFTNEYIQKLFGVDEPYYARVLSPNLHWSPKRFRARDLLTMGIECEIAFRMAKDLPPRERLYTEEDVAEAVASMHPSIEVVNAHFTDWLNITAPNIVADNGTDGALVCGSGTSDWRQIDRVELPVVLRVNGEAVAAGKGKNALGDPLKALTWLANALRAKGPHLKAGEIVNTGTCTPLVQGEPGDEIHATFGELGEVRIGLE